MLDVRIIGYVGRDASIKEFNGEKTMYFPVAHSEKITDKDGNTVDKTTWITCFMRSRFKLCEYIKKGTLVAIDGSLNLNLKSYQGKYGIDVTSNVFKVELLRSATPNGETNSESEVPY